MFTKIVCRALVFGLLLFGSAAASAQLVNVQRVIMDPRFLAAEDFVVTDHDRFVREIIQITEIEAPPFKEAKRGKAFADMLRQSGLSNVEIDAEGNVIGSLRPLRDRR